MHFKPPLQVLLIRAEADPELLQLETAIEKVFVGGVTTAGYVATGEDLGVELRRFHESPELSVSISELMDAACHTLVVALVGKDGLSEDLQKVIRAAGKHVAGSRNHGLVGFVARASATSVVPTGRGCQTVSVESVGERAVRPALVGLRVLQECRSLLAQALDQRAIGSPLGLTLFISHAKLDGLPLAQSLEFQIRNISWLTSFYDTRDLANDPNWEQSLQAAAISSVLVVLRTEAYEHRPWCQQEALWAEERGVPTVLVEARPGLAYPAGELPLERMPSVRIPDGNLLRVLNAALRESLRYLLFQRRVVDLMRTGPLRTKQVEAFSYPPSMSGLLWACRKIGDQEAVILYPDPPLRRGVFEAAVALVHRNAPNAKLMTPASLVADPGL